MVSDLVDDINIAIHSVYGIAQAISFSLRNRKIIKGLDYDEVPIVKSTTESFLPKGARKNREA